VHWGIQRLLPKTSPRGQLHNRLILRRWRGAFDAFQKDLVLEGHCEENIPIGQRMPCSRSANLVSNPRRRFVSITFIMVITPFFVA
jgi:hypothetical protein